MTIMKGFFIAMLCLMFGLVLPAAAQVQYVITFQRPGDVSDEAIRGLFSDNSDFSQVGVRGDILTLVVPSAVDYPILAIRERLAGLKVAALDYKETEMKKAGTVEASTLATSEFKVYGNCGMCEERIVRAARSVKGVLSATWDDETLMLSIKYRSGLVQPEAVHQAVAAAGHDTDLVKAEDAVYRDLHHCCKYERPKAGDK